MNKKIISLIMFGIICSPAFGAIDWWNFDDEFVCQVDNTPCYSGLTQGVDDEWDVAASCRGRKYICADAFNTNTPSAVAINMSEITNNVNSDFDVTVYVAGENCYGTRKTTDNGRMASVNGRYVKVWCNGVLVSPTETLSNGEITTGPEPTCKQLATDGFAAIANGGCYGKYYNPANYAIECDGENPTLIVLNGAEYNPNGSNTVTASVANSRFSTMQTSAATQRAKHFNQ